MQDFLSTGRELPLTSLLDEMREAPRNGATPIVGIDGRAGGGKSTLCDALAALDPSIAVVHTDGFYVPPDLRTAPDEEVGRQIDWRRIVEEVVTPLFYGKPARYRRFDWDAHALRESHTAKPGGLVLLDGVYSTREDIAPLLTLRVWVEVSRELGLQRAIDRDGQESEDWWMSDWVEDEDRYVLIETPMNRADIVVDGNVSPDIYAHGVHRRLR